jgi:hypothetical protein
MMPDGSALAVTEDVMGKCLPENVCPAVILATMLHSNFLATMARAQDPSLLFKKSIV